MIKVEKSVVIRKPVEEVFSFVTAEGNSTKWVEVMDWTATGAPPPTGAFPTRIWRVIFLVIAAGSLMNSSV